MSDIFFVGNIFSEIFIDLGENFFKGNFLVIFF